LFLDATSDEVSFGQPSAFIQNRMACIAIDANRFENIIVPTIPAEKNAIVDTFVCKMKGDTLVGTGSQWLYGYRRNNITQAFKTFAKEKYDDLMKGILSRGNDKCKIESPKVFQLFEEDKPLYMTFQASIEHIGRTIDKELYINLNLNKSWQGLIAELENRTNGVEVDYLWHRKEHLVFELPKGATIKNLPTTASNENAFVAWKIEYRAAGNKILIDTSIRLKKLEVERKDVESWNQAFTDIKEAQSQYVILTLP
jgi:hypothetical protein